MRKFGTKSMHRNFKYKEPTVQPIWTNVDFFYSLLQNSIAQMNDENEILAYRWIFDDVYPHFFLDRNKKRIEIKKKNHLQNYFYIELLWICYIKWTKRYIIECKQKPIAYSQSIRRTNMIFIQRGSLFSALINQLISNWFQHLFIIYSDWTEYFKWKSPIRFIQWKNKIHYRFRIFINNLMLVSFSVYSKKKQWKWKWKWKLHEIELWLENNLCECHCDCE